MKKYLAFLLASLMLLSTLAGCGGGGGGSGGAPADGQPTGGGEGAAYKDTLTWAQSSDVTSMDPHVGKETAAVTVTCNMFSTLMITLGDDDPQPLLAES